MFCKFDFTSHNHIEKFMRKYAPHANGNAGVGQYAQINTLGNAPITWLYV